MRLADFLKQRQENRSKNDPPTFVESVEWFKVDLQNDNTIKEASREYRLRCLNKIQETWPELWTLRLDEIKVANCKEWAAKLHKLIAGHYYNNVVGTLRQVIGVGIKAHKGRGGTIMENPAAELQRVRVKSKELQLPEPSQFRELVENIRKKSGGWGPRCADLIEFLACGGMRINSEARWVEWEDVD